jgi:hypothetical protein
VESVVARVVAAVVGALPAAVEPVVFRVVAIFAGALPAAVESVVARIVAGVVVALKLVLLEPYLLQWSQLLLEQ